MLRFRAFSAFAAALAIMVAAGACDSGGGDSTPAAGDAGGQTELVPGPGQAVVTGSIRRFVADSAGIGMPLTVPFTISALERGTGNATIENALVDGNRSTISWSTGTPLPISGTGGLNVDGAHVEVDTVGITWTLDGSARNLVPGSYRVGAPVAVGTVGIATPRDSVEFDADDRTILTTQGGVVIHLNPAPVKLEGPGALHITGQLQVRTTSGKRGASNVTFAEAPFTASLTPSGNQLRLEGVLQGPVDSS